MSIQVQCPGCSDSVTAEESDRGKTIKCGTCWTPVNIPAAEGGAPKPATADHVPSRSPESLQQYPVSRIHPP